MHPHDLRHLLTLAENATDRLTDISNSLSSLAGLRTDLERIEHRLHDVLDRLGSIENSIPPD